MKSSDLNRSPNASARCAHSTRPSIQLACLAFVCVLIAWLQGAYFPWKNVSDIKDDRSSRHYNIYSSKVKRCRFGAVAADSDVCSAIGTDILALQNGSAADAAIAALICVGVVNMHSAGIGGGSVILAYHRSTQTMTSIDSLPAAAQAPPPQTYAEGPLLAERGGKSIAVPGDVAGLWRLHQIHGRLPWRELIKPTITLCERGIEIEGALHRAIKHIKPYVTKFPHLHALITNGTMEVKLTQGDSIRRPKYAETLRRLAAHGGDDFYTGSLARDILADLREAGSFISDDDLRTYRVREYTPLKSSLGGYDIHTPSAPSGGPVVHLILKILKGYQFKKRQYLDPLDYHRITEAMKFAFAKRAELGDPDYTNITSVLREMMDDATGRQIRNLIRDETTLDFASYGGRFGINYHNGTTHISVVDAEGNAVSITSSINTWFGSYVVGNRTGILFNGGMDDFGIPGKLNHFNVSAAPTNYIEAGKRALSSKTPIIALDKMGDVKLTTGAAGGTHIISTLSVFVLRLLVMGQTLETAMDSARFHHQLYPNTLSVESFFDHGLIGRLEEKGHAFKRHNPRMSVIQTVFRNGSYLFSVSDARKGGLADGY